MPWRRLPPVPALLVVLALATGASLPARLASAASERIVAYSVELEVERGGGILVTETITYDFGADERHGIFRDIVTAQRFDEKRDRSYPLRVISVTATPAGTPAEYRVEDAGAGRERIRVGDPDRTVTGQHTYVLTYRLGAALNGFPDHDELYWNVIGAQWDVPILRAAVTVRTPARPTDLACFAGPEGSNLPCGSAVIEGNAATFSHAGLDPYEGLTVVVALPKGAVAEPAPILKERQTLSRAFTLSPLRLALASALLAGVGAGVARLWWAIGRDRQWRGQPVAALPARAGDVEDPVPLFNGAAYPVEYTPPDGMRPGLVGTVLDETAHPLDVSATIVDLAVRGYMRIEEIEGKGWFASDDWRLTKLRGVEGLVPYEASLLEGLFQAGDAVKFSDLREKFAARLARVQTELYGELVRRTWYRHSPGTTRSIWLAVGVAATLAAAALEAIFAVFTSFAVVPVPLVLGGLALVTLHGKMPARTALGTATYRRVLGFRRFVLDAETYRARFAEQAGLYYDYLPYAIVFGATKQWARAFEGLAMPAPDWYRSSRPLSAFMLADALGGFSDRSVGALTATPGGSGGSGFSGGFSGGGGGGGGGGSW